MKKILVIGGVIYIVTYVGACVWMVANPEGYGKMFGKMWAGLCEGLEGLVEKEEI